MRRFTGRTASLLQSTQKFEGSYIRTLNMLSNNALEDFKRIWKEEYGTDIPNDFAVEQATTLLTFFNAIYKPLKKEWVDEYDHERIEKHTK